MTTKLGIGQAHCDTGLWANITYLGGVFFPLAVEHTLFDIQ